MSFNRRGGPDRRPDRFQRSDRDRGPRQEGGGEWQPRDRGPGGGRPFAPRGDRPFQPRPGGDRPYQPRGGGDRLYQPRPQFDRPADDGAMSIRLDPRRVTVLKRLASEAGMRPGDLVRHWVEERLDVARQGIDTPDAAKQLTEQMAELAERVASLEAAAGLTPPSPAAAEDATIAEDAATEPVAAAEEPRAPEAEAEETVEPATDLEPAKRPRANRVTAKPAGPRIALHDEMIAVLAERGPMPAAELAAAVAERGRYQPPRSGKPLDAAMISQRVSNPVYRARFTRNEGRIGLAESAE
jgi:hypothetical protein